MPLQPTTLHLAKSPEQQAVSCYTKISTGKTQNTPPSYNEILNSGNAFTEGPIRWDSIGKAIQKTIQAKHYKTFQNSFIAFEIVGPLSRIGIVGVIPSKELNNRVHNHEATDEKRAAKFANYLKTVGYQAEPCVLAFQEDKEWQEIQETIRRLPNGKTFSIAGIMHRLWWITDHQKTVFENLNHYFSHQHHEFTLVDGHHRKQAIQTLEAQGIATPLLCYCLPHTAIISKSFFWQSQQYPPSIEQWVKSKGHPLKKAPDTLSDPNIVLIRLQEIWYEFRDANHRSILQKIYQAFASHAIPIDYQPQKDAQINREASQNKASFFMTYSPLNFEQVMSWAKKNECLPPKTTYLEPKVPLGLFLHPV